MFDGFFIRVCMRIGESSLVPSPAEGDVCTSPYTGKRGTRLRLRAERRNQLQIMKWRSDHRACAVQVEDQVHVCVTSTLGRDTLLITVMP